MLFGVIFFALKVSNRQTIGILMGFGGALLLTLTRGGDFDPFENLFYSFIVVLATMGYGISTIVMKKYLDSTPSVPATGYALTFAAIPYLIYLIGFSDIGSVFANSEAAYISFFYILILGAIGTALAVVLFYRLIKMTDAIIAASVTYLIPLVALGWGLVDGETFTIGQAGGILVILAGVWLVNRK